MSSTEQNHCSVAPVDDRLLAAPAVRVLVDDLLHREEVAGGFQLLGDRLVGGVGRKARELARELGQLAELIDRHDDFDLGIVLRADVEVLDAVAGAVWTQPVPLSSVTWSPRMTGDCRSRKGCW